MRPTLTHVAGLAAGFGVAWAWTQRTGAEARLLLGTGGPAGWPVLAGLLVLALIGNAILRWLPAGHRGGFGPRDLATTWASGQLIGLVAVELLGLALDPSGAALPWTVFGLGAALALARWLTRPAPMAPGYPRRGEAHARAITSGLLALAAFGVLLALRATPASAALEADTAAFGVPGAATLVLARLVPAGDVVGVCRVVGATSWIAVAVLVHGALRDARREPLSAAVGTALVALTPLPLLRAWQGGPIPLATFFFAAGCTALVPWLRHADRQALVVAAVAFLGCALIGHPALALGGLLAVVATSPRPALKFAVQALAATLALAAVFVVLGDRPAMSAATASAVPADLVRAAGLADYGLAWILFVVSMVATAVLRPMRPMQTGNAEPAADAAPTIEPPRREKAALGIAIAFGAAGELTGTGTAAVETLLLVFPVAALAAALVLLPVERAAQPPSHSAGDSR